jgi:hypothetical protein
MHKYGKVAGISRAAIMCHPHVLKHSSCSQMIQAAGIENVRHYLGHKSIAFDGRLSQGFRSRGHSSDCDGHALATSTFQCRTNPGCLLPFRTRPELALSVR